MTTKTELLKTIRSKCLDCCCGQVQEVKLCTSTNCPLYDYRLGVDPFKPQVSTKKKAAAILALQKARAIKKEQEA